MTYSIFIETTCARSLGFALVTYSASFRHCALLASGFCPFSALLLDFPLPLPGPLIAELCV